MVRRDNHVANFAYQNLKSAEEMEEEEREAQSAKLQELIRRGAPEDLQEANRLMKIMAGYDTRSKVDYRAKAAEDVSKIQAKAKLLEERLAEFKPGDKMTDGDVFEELASALSSAQPKIQKMCEEESDDHDAVARLFEINDSIHRTVERYKLMKQGDLEAASKIARGEHVASSAAVKSAAQELNLIDFDGDAGTNGSGSGNGNAVAGPSSGNLTQPGGLEDDLLGLSIGDSEPGGSYGQTGGISLGFGSNTSRSKKHRRLVTRLTQIYRCPRTGLALFPDRGEQRQRPCLNIHASPAVFGILCFQLSTVHFAEQHAPAVPVSLSTSTSGTVFRPIRRSCIVQLVFSTGASASAQGCR